MGGGGGYAGSNVIFRYVDTMSVRKKSRNINVCVMSFLSGRRHHRWKIKSEFKTVKVEI